MKKIAMLLAAGAIALSAHAEGGKKKWGDFITQADLDAGRVVLVKTEKGETKQLVSIGLSKEYLEKNPKHKKATCRIKLTEFEELASRQLMAMSEDSDGESEEKPKPGPAVYVRFKAHAITSDDGYFMGIDCYGPGSGCEMKLE